MNWETEAVFGQMKQDFNYRRFRHFGKDKVKMNFAFFAIAFNIRKLCSKIAKIAKNGGDSPHFGSFEKISAILKPENPTFVEIQQIIAA